MGQSTLAPQQAKVPLYLHFKPSIDPSLAKQVETTNDDTEG